MNQTKIAQFANAQDKETDNGGSNNAIKEELELLKQLQKQKQEESDEHEESEPASQSIEEKSEPISTIQVTNLISGRK